MKNMIAILKDKLSLSDCPKDSDTIFDYFNDIASLLMNNYVISKCDNIYEFIDIEFYLCSPEHPDVITYPRTIKAGQWFFHPSGVDLTFESNQTRFGGILIRGLRRLPDNKLILGPLKCVDELWHHFDALSVDPKEIPHIVSNIVPECPIKKDIRWIKANPEKINYWKNRIPSNCAINKSDDELTKLIFESTYRFFKSDSQITDNSDWKKYSAKPKGR